MVVKTMQIYTFIHKWVCQLRLININTSYFEVWNVVFCYKITQFNIKKKGGVICLVSIFSLCFSQYPILVNPTKKCAGDFNRGTFFCRISQSISIR